MALEKAGLQLVAEGAAQYIGDIGRAESASKQFGSGIESAAAATARAAGTIGGASQNAAGLWQDASGKWRNASGQFATSAEQAAAGVVAATDRVGSEGSRGFSALEQAATGALRRVGEIAVNALMAAGQAAGQFTVDSITAAGDFEAAVNNLAAISGDALAQAGFSFDDVSAKALQLGQDTRYSASESIAAMTELVKGGVPVAEVMDAATDATLNLAAAAGVELGSAAEIVAKQFGVWSDTGVTATQVSDLLTQAANASTVGVEDLALGLANAGGTAKTAGVEFDDLVQTMALIAPNFSSASDAGTSLKTFLSRLIPSTKPATAAMIELGLATEDGKSKFYDAQGAFIGMEAAAKLLQQQTAHLSEEQRLQAFNTIFGADAIRAAAAIAEGGAEAFNQMGVDMAAAGTAAEVAAMQNQGFNFAMDSLKGSIETLQIVIGSALLPIITQFINEALIPGIAVAQTFAQALFGNAEAFGQLSPQLQTVVTGVQGFLVAAQPVADFIGANLVPILTTLAAVAGGLVVGAIIAAAAPFAPLIGIIGAAIAIGAALYAGWQANFAGVQQAVTAALTAVQGVVTSVVGAVKAFWDRNGAEITASAQRWWGQAQESIAGAVAVISSVVTSVLGAVQGFIENHGSEIQSVLDYAWNSIANVIDLAMNTIQGVVTTILGIVTGDWEKASSGIQQIVDGIATYIGNQFENIKTLVTNVGPGLLSAAQSVGKAIVDGIAAGISAGASAIANAAKAAAQAALDAAKKLLGIKSPSQLFADVIGQNISLGMAQGILAAAAAPLAAVSSVAGSTLGAAMATVSGPSAAATYASYGGAVYGPSINVDARGSTLGAAQIEAAVKRGLDATASKANRIARQRGGFS